MRRIFFIILITGLFNIPNYAQTCGFGCLGLSGAYAGYTYEQYSANGIDEIVKSFKEKNALTGNVDFKEARGYRFGANIFRAQFNHFFFSAKGFYQFLKEEKSKFSSPSNVPTEEKYTLTLNHWGVGLDLGIPVFNFLDLKLVEGGVTFYNSGFKAQVNRDGKEVSTIEYENNKTDIGYYLGSGIIIHIIKDYISLEGTAFYHKLNITQMNPLENSSLQLPLPGESFVDKGGLGGTVQLNIGFPL